MFTHQAIVLILIGQLLFSNLVFSDVKKRKEIKHIEVALITIPTELDPMKIWSYHYFFMSQALFTNLVRINDKGQIVSGLAKRWSFSKDLKTIEYELDKNATFSDGSAITSKDVAFSLSRHLWPGSTSVLKGYLVDLVVGMEEGLAENKLASGVDFTDSQRLKIKLTKPYLPIQHLLAMPGLGIVSHKNLSLHSGPMTGSFDSEKKIWRLKKRDGGTGPELKINSINVRAENNVESLLKMVGSGEVDFSMGFTVADIHKHELTGDAVMRKSGSLSFHHMYFNIDKKVFKNKDFRHELGRRIQELAWDSKSISEYLQPLSTFLPRGIMPMSYHDRKLSTPPDLNQFKKKWGDTLKSQTFRIVLVKGLFNKGFVSLLKKEFDSLGITYELLEISGREYMETIKNRSYDIISTPYVGNFPDPDGFLETINPASGINVGSKFSAELFANLSAVKHHINPVERLKVYTEKIREFEDGWSAIPLYSVDFPIVYNSKLSVPDAKFRYESELWNIFWKSN